MCSVHNLVIRKVPHKSDNHGRQGRLHDNCPKAINYGCTKYKPLTIKLVSSHVYGPLLTDKHKITRVEAWFSKHARRLIKWQRTFKTHLHYFNPQFPNISCNAFTFNSTTRSILIPQFVLFYIKLIIYEIRWAIRFWEHIRAASLIENLHQHPIFSTRNIVCPFNKSTYTTKTTNRLQQNVLALMKSCPTINSRNTHTTLSVHSSSLNDFIKFMPFLKELLVFVPTISFRCFEASSLYWESILFD